MGFSSIVPIVEGPGEVEAASLLLRRMLERNHSWNIRIQRPINAHGIGNIIKLNGLGRFLKVAEKRDACHAVLILLDAEGSCAREVAGRLATRARNHSPHLPIAVVAAKCHYENWLLGSTETLAGKSGLKDSLEIISDPESVPDSKRWLTDHMEKGKAYKETFDQAPLSKAIDIDLVCQRARSFRRLEQALEQLICSIKSGTPLISP